MLRLFLSLLLIPFFFVFSCVSAPRVLDNVAGTPIPPGKTRITVQRSDQFFSGGGVALRILDLNGYQNAEEAIVLINFNPAATIDIEKYIEPIEKTKKSLVYKKIDYDRIETFPVIVSESTKEIFDRLQRDSGKSPNPVIASQSIPHWATSSMGSGRAGRLYTVDQMQRPDSASLHEATSGIAALITAGISSKLSETEICVDKGILEKGLTCTATTGKEIAKLKLSEKVSWDREPGRIELYAIADNVIPADNVVHGFFTGHDFKAGTEYVLWLEVGPSKEKGGRGSLIFSILEQPERLGILAY